MPKRTEDDRAHAFVKKKISAKQDNILGVVKVVDVTERQAVIDMLIPISIDDVAFAFRMKGRSGNCSYEISVEHDKNDFNTEVLRGPITMNSGIMVKNHIPAGSVLSIFVDTDDHIDEVYVTIIGNYSGIGNYHGTRA